MMRKIKQLLEDMETVEDVYVFEDTFFITHVRGSRVDESDVDLLVGGVESEGIDLSGCEYGFYSHPINEEVYGIFLKI